MAKIVIFGVGQLAEVAHFYLTHDSPHEVAAFTVDSEYLKADTHAGVPAVAFEQVEEIYPADQFRMFVPVVIGTGTRCGKRNTIRPKRRGTS